MKNWSTYGKVIVLIVLALVSIGLVWFLAYTLGGAFGHASPDAAKAPNLSDHAEIALTLLVSGSIVALLAVLVIVVATFSTLGLADKKQAFGLPEGTVRAILALLLLLIFTIVSLYLYSSANTQQTRTLSAVPAALVDALPLDRLVSKVPVGTDGKAFDVVLTVENPAGADLAKQLLTTLSTLVVAVSSFYFGARTSASSNAKSEGKAENKPSLKLSKPTSPQKLAKGAPEAVNIELDVHQGGQAVVANVDGDSKTTVTETSPNRFTYTPTNLDGPVVITFALKDHPEVTDKLEIERA